MKNDQELFSELDPELVDHMTSNRDNVWQAVKTTAILTSVPITMGALAGVTFGQGGGLPQQIVDVLNFALTLEYLEDEFYRTGVSTSGLIPDDARTIFEQISKHETAHVNLLQGVLGASAIPKPQFDFTAASLFPDVFSNFLTFAALSQTFEDTGVRAYKGQATNLMSNDEILTTALRIHSVEARHAAEVRRLRGEKGWITGASRGSLPAATQPSYDGEDNTVQLGIDLAGANLGVPASAITEAFDEPLTREQVLAIADPFIVG